MLIKSEHNGHILEHDEEKHIYKLDGKTLDGVTTILKHGYPTSQRIIDWQIREGVKWALNVRDLELGDDDWIVKESPNAYRKALDEAGDIGSIVHDYAYKVEKGLSVELSKDEIIQRCCKQFDEWRESNKDEIIALEELVCSTSLKYAGRFDRLCMRNGRVVLSDYKTSSNFYITQFLQMAAYAIAIEEWIGMEVEDIEIVRFDKKTGKLSTRNLTQLANTIGIKNDTCMKRLKKQFLNCFDTYHFKQKMDKYIRK